MYSSRYEFLESESHFTGKVEDQNLSPYFLSLAPGGHSSLVADDAPLWGATWSRVLDGFLRQAQDRYQS